MKEEREYKHQLDLPVLLPEISDSKDQCIERLTEQLLRNQGVSRAHVDESGPQAMLCMHYDPNIIPLDRLERIARSAGAGITKRYRHRSYHVLGMGCTNCAASIEHILSRTEGIIHVSVNYAAERMRVEYDTDHISSDKIVSKIRGMGYDVPARRREGWIVDHRELLLSLFSGFFLAAGFLGKLSGLLPPPAAIGLYLAAYVTGGFNATRHGIQAAIHIKFDIDFLMVVAAVGAATIGQWVEGALLLFLFSLGHSLEHSALGKARKAIDQLNGLLPRKALVRRDGREVLVDTSELLRGDVVVVRPGDRVPIDGTVTSGDSGIDESAITGESMPKLKTPGQVVYAGTINGDGALVIEVTKLSRETMLSRIISMVEEAQTQKAPTERVVERFERIFVPVVLATVLLVIAVPLLAGLLPFKVAFLRAMTVLVAASPCALAIATPAAILSGIARAARSGVLIKGGMYLETLGRVRAIAFDKTGTITQGRPSIATILSAAGVSEERVLTAAAAAERQSKHPLALAVVEEAERRGLELPQAEAVQAVGGRGLTATVDGRSVAVGSPAFMAEQGLEAPEGMRRELEEQQDTGKTAVFVAENGSIIGALAFTDSPRPNAAPTLQELRRLGVAKLALITGDNLRVAEAVGREVGIQDRRAGLLPDEKVRAIDELIRRYGPTAMVGDGVNDAPALARASVGIAMGAHGSDVAIETADVALMSDDLTMLPFVVGLSRKARRIVIENLVVALGVIGVLLGSAVFGVVTIGVAIVVHEGSTLLVVANALRLLGYRSRERSTL
ncbi:MAG TPA: heavy metal translocating P-type ATPase [Spirochaetia bacterium]|nr:heavy metal translocating P-type ATPase [Spirochaetia bacterium]